MADDDPRSTNGRRVVITSSTLMPLGVVVAIVLALWRGSSYLDSRFEQLAASDRAINDQLTFIKMATANRWSLSDMRLWTSQLKVANPSLTVPDVLNVVDPMTAGSRRVQRE